VSPLTHLLASWIVAAKTTDNLRDRRLVTLAGVAPDLDGLGIFVDAAKGRLRPESFFTIPNTTIGWRTDCLARCLLDFAGRVWPARWRVLLLSLLTFHLHLMCDLIGSRGPDKTDFWPIFYFGPITQHRCGFGNTSGGSTAGRTR